MIATLSVVLSYARRILALNGELLDITQRAGVSGEIRIGGPQDLASVLPEVLSHFAAAIAASPPADAGDNCAVAEALRQ